MKVLSAELSLAKRAGGPDQVCASTREVMGGLGVEITRCDTASVSDHVLTDFDLIHIHGLWAPSLARLAGQARREGVPYLVSTHGMLEPWAMQQKPWRKRLALALYQRKVLDGAAGLHATAEAEAANLRRFGLRAPVEVVPLGMSLPPLPEPRLREPGARRTFLFLSRIHPKKGLLSLVEAWKSVRRPDWQVRVVGPDENNHLAEVRAAVEAAGVAPDFVFDGPLYDDAKDKAYQESDCFVLPTYSENFALVVPEALAGGLPVITTQATPWQELTEKNCGWWIEVGVEPLARAMLQAMQLSDTERRAMGLRGRHLVETNYSWDTIAAKLYSLYEKTCCC